MFSLLARSGMATGTRLFGAALTFATQILLARLLGPESLGVYFIAISAAAIAAIVGCLGFPGTTARFVARYQTRDRQGLKDSFARVSQDNVFRASSLIAFAIAATSLVFLDREFGVALALSATAIPALSILRLNSALALAGRRPWIAYLPDMVGRPLLLVSMLAVAYWAGFSIGLVGVLVMSVFAAIALAAAQMWPIGRLYGGGRQSLLPSHRLRRLWRNSSLPLLPVALLVGLFADTNLLLLSTVMEPADIAIYGVALKLAFLAGYGIQASQQLILPDMAEAMARSDAAELRRALTRTLATSAVVSVLALVTLAAAGPYVLALFGPHYEAGYGAMLILVAAQMFRIPEGIAVQFLTVSGHAIRVLVNLGITTIVLAASSMALVPLWGTIGAAAAVLLTLLASSIIFVTTAITIYRRRSGRREGNGFPFAA
jgi:O-antigen/teichoic acid export membrane protein